MKTLKIQKIPKILIDLKFSILILTIIAFASSFGSFIEQDEPISFYEENYPETKPIYGFVTSKIILSLGLDHVYNTWWFLLLILILSISLAVLFLKFFFVFLAHLNSLLPFQSILFNFRSF